MSVYLIKANPIQYSTIIVHELTLGD